MGPEQASGKRIAAGWPDPVEVLNPGGQSDVVLICEHASNYIPPEYSALGLQPADLLRHIAWDPGAAEVTRKLAPKLGAVAFLSTASRLLIDLNRPLGVPSSIPEVSEDTLIHGNVGVSEEERERRVNALFTPFHEAVQDCLETRRRASRPTIVITIHSFTPVFLSVRRPWHAGVLYDQSESEAQMLIDSLRKRSPGMLIKANVPYTVTADEDYAIPRYGTAMGNPALLVEIRNDQIGDDLGTTLWSDLLAGSIHDLIGWCRSADSARPE